MPNTTRKLSPWVVCGSWRQGRSRKIRLTDCEQRQSIYASRTAGAYVGGLKAAIGCRDLPRFRRTTFMKQLSALVSWSPKFLRRSAHGICESRNDSQSSVWRSNFGSRDWQPWNWGREITVAESTAPTFFPGVIRGTRHDTRIGDRDRHRVAESPASVTQIGQVAPRYSTKLWLCLGYIDSIGQLPRSSNSPCNWVIQHRPPSRGFLVNKPLIYHVRSVLDISGHITSTRTATTGQRQRARLLCLGTSEAT